jgi:hypothetical protein
MVRCRGGFYYYPFLTHPDVSKPAPTEFPVLFDRLTYCHLNAEQINKDAIVELADLKWLKS